jgi:hypothetical protein
LPARAIAFRTHEWYNLYLWRVALRALQARCGAYKAVSERRRRTGACRARSTAKGPGSREVGHCPPIMRFRIQLEVAPPAAHELFRLRPSDAERGEAHRLINRTRPRNLARPRSRLVLAARSNAAVPYLQSIPASVVPPTISLLVASHRAPSRRGRLAHLAGGWRTRDDGLDCASTAGRYRADVGRGCGFGVNRHTV